MDRTNHDIDVEQLPVIELSNREQAIVEHIANLRNLTYDGIDGGQVLGSQTSLQAHLTGTRGEFAVAKFFDGLDLFDINVLLPFGDEGVDFELWGKTLDVKATATGMRVPDLLLPEDSDLTAEWYVLAHILDPATVRMVGMASRQQVLSHPVREEPFEQRNYWVQPSDLILFTRE